ncbi:MAG: hypothetical protein J5716_06190 [Alphaproteobacteria bacterium]|nr:hypothetical protein [Alphaproteobacteria bacterium]
MTENKNTLEQDSLTLHASGRPGKIEIIPTKPLNTKRDLALAYSPGVAAPCLEIEKNPDEAFRYTAKGNLVAVISNGTAVLGLGSIGSLASKPVMEGKSVLFKKFADVDSIDIEINSLDPDKVVETAALIGDTFGGINLEDIKAPECFYIESELKKRLNIPVFHDDQHGTAVVVAAGLVNGLELTGKKIEEIKLVVNGAGAAAIACASLLRELGVKNIIMCDSKGVIYKGRTAGMNPFKESFAAETDVRTLAEAVRGADVFLGLSVKGALTPEMVKTMNKQPLIYALANPNPEITPEEALAAAPDAIVATGRSDYPNQVNNVLGFPYIFRGALDVRASQINEKMKLAAARALAELARADGLSKDKIIPSPFDDRLIETVPVAVAKTACETGVAQKPFDDWDAYRAQLKKRTKKG